LLQMYLYRNVTFCFFWQVKVYSFVVVLEATVKGYTIVFIFFFCLCIHCVLKVPFSMVSEFTFIQPSSTKVQLKGNMCPFFFSFLSV